MKNFVFRALCALAAVTAVSPDVRAQTAAAAPPLPAGVTGGASVEGITQYDFSNGFRLLLFPDPTKTSTTVNMTYLVGSRNEGYGETGMAHLLEHMLFKGTPKHANVMQELTEHGTRPNGSTSFDRTNYFETFQSSDENLNWALALEADRMVNSFVAKKDLDSEMTVVRNEFESGENSPANILEERVLSTAYLWHNYGNSTIGARSDIENVPIERLQAFYRKYYQPDNAVLTVAGHVEEAKVLALAARYFGAIPRPQRVLEQTYTEEPVQDGERSVTLRRTGDSEVMIVGVHVPALAHPDGPLASLLADVFTNAPSGRLYKALVDTKKAGSVGSNSTDTREPGMLLLRAQAPSAVDLNDLQNTFLGVMDDVEKSPPTEEEVNRSKAKLSKQFDLLTRDSERLGLFLSEFIGAGDWRLAFITRDRIGAASTQDVDRFARTYLKCSNRTVGLFIPTDKPDRAEVPKTPDVEALVRNYKGSQNVELGEAFDTTPASIDQKTIRGKLEGGMKLALISKKTRGGVVQARLRLHFGDENNLKGKQTAASLAGAMLMRGTANHTRQQIADQLDQLKAQVRVAGSQTGATAVIQTTRANLPAVLDLVGEILRAPSFPQHEFDTLKQQRLTQLESQRREPTRIAQLNSLRHLHPYSKDDVRYIPTVDEQIEMLKAVDLPQAKQFYSDFYGASNAELAVVGDFDAEQLQKQASALFHDWRSKQHYARVEASFRPVPAVNESFETPDKANAVFIALQPVKMDDDNPDYPSLTLADFLLGGGMLNSRLATRIRVKDGLSYSVGSNLEVPTKENAGAFSVFAISAPQNTAKVEADVKEEMQRAMAAGFSDAEVSAAKSGWLQSSQVSRSQDNELVGALADQAFWDRTMKWDADFERRVAALTTAQVNAALRKYLDVAKFSIFKAGDFAKTNTPSPAGTSGPTK